MCLVKGTEVSMVAQIGCVETLAYKLEDIDVKVTDEDWILALTIGLNDSYDSCLISLNSTPVSRLTLEHVTDW